MSAGSKIKQIRDIAIQTVLQYEASKGRKAQDRSHERKLGYDVESEGRLIEVKGLEWTWSQLRTGFVYITENERRTATHIYTVCDVFGSPDLHIFEMAKLPQSVFKTEVHYEFRLKHARDFEEK